MPDKDRFAVALVAKRQLTDSGHDLDSIRVIAHGPRRRCCDLVQIDIGQRASFPGVEHPQACQSSGPSGGSPRDLDGISSGIFEMRLFGPAAQFLHLIALRILIV
jgi:hypothetical protein